MFTNIYNINSWSRDFVTKSTIEVIIVSPVNLHVEIHREMVPIINGWMNRRERIFGIQRSPDLNIEWTITKRYVIRQIRIRNTTYLVISFDLSFLCFLPPSTWLVTSHLPETVRSISQSPTVIIKRRVSSLGVYRGL